MQGAVTLTGYVDTETQKSLATVLASGVRGVRSVNNKLALTGTGQADLALVAQVKTALSRQPFATRRIIVTSNQGIVTLSGVAESDFARDQAPQVAIAVQGVSAVHNNIIVSNPGQTF